MNSSYRWTLTLHLVSAILELVDEFWSFAMKQEVVITSINVRCVI